MPVYIVPLPGQPGGNDPRVDALEVAVEQLDEQADATKDLLEAHVLSDHAHRAAAITYSEYGEEVPLQDKIEQYDLLVDAHLTSDHAHHAKEIVLGEGDQEIHLDQKIADIEARLGP